LIKATAQVNTFLTVKKPVSQGKRLAERQVWGIFAEFQLVENIPENARQKTSPLGGRLKSWPLCWVLPPQVCCLALCWPKHPFWTGLLLGFRFELLVIGFLGIRRSDAGRILAYWNKDWALFGGATATAPRPDSVKLPQKMALILLAGPVASLIWKGCCWGFMHHFPRFWVFGLLVSGLVSIALFLATTLPDRTGVFSTDRKRFQRLTGGGKEREIEMALREVLRHEQMGLPIQSLEREKLLMICEDEAAMFRFFGYSLLRMYDRDDPEKRSQ